MLTFTVPFAVKLIPVELISLTLKFMSRFVIGLELFLLPVGLLKVIFGWPKSFAPKPPEKWSTKIYVYPVANADSTADHPQEPPVSQHALLTGITLVELPKLKTVALH